MDVSCKDAMLKSLKLEKYIQAVSKMTSNIIFLRFDMWIWMKLQLWEIISFQV